LGDSVMAGSLFLGDSDMAGFLFFGDSNLWQSCNDNNKKYNFINSTKNMILTLTTPE
jgi:hypothetical protein